MSTTLLEIHINGEVIDLSEFATQEAIKSSKNEIIDAINNSVQQYDSIIATQLEAIIG